MVGGLFTTPTDYANFLIAIIDPKPSDAFRLTKDSLEEMLRPQVKRNAERPDERTFYGCSSSGSGSG